MKDTGLVGTKWSSPLHAHWMKRIVTGNSLGNWRFLNNCERSTPNKQKQKKEKNKKPKTQSFFFEYKKNDFLYVIQYL